MRRPRPQDLGPGQEDPRLRTGAPAQPGDGLIPGFDYAYDPATGRLAKVR
jgi:hypothetical protein